MADTVPDCLRSVHERERDTPPKSAAHASQQLADVPGGVEIWESEGTRPPCFNVAPETVTALREGFERELPGIMQRPYAHPDDIRVRQFDRVRELVWIAYESTAVYRDKYDAAGFHPRQLVSPADVARIPVITKAELVAAFPDRCLNPAFQRADLFPTRSSGSSGQTLLIRVNAEAVITDTVQGVRQFVMQSGLRWVGALAPVAASAGHRRKRERKQQWQ